jgi:hypothetical protein
MFARRYRKIGWRRGCGSTLAVFDARDLRRAVLRLEQAKLFETSLRIGRSRLLNNIEKKAAALDFFPKRGISLIKAGGPAV